jgi:beta-glucanase (GH16 family)
MSLAGSIFAAAGSGAETSSGATKWELVWSDEFDYQGLPDPKKWDYEERFVRNQEPQYYTRARLENARVENGTLIIEARKERFTNPRYNPGATNQNRGRAQQEFADYTSTSLVTWKKASWQYGRFEIRAKLPLSVGSGCCG